MHDIRKSALARAWGFLERANLLPHEVSMSRRTLAKLPNEIAEHGKLFGCDVHLTERYPDDHLEIRPSPDFGPQSVLVRLNLEAGTAELVSDTLCAEAKAAAAR